MSDDMSTNSAHESNEETQHPYTSLGPLSDPVFGTGPHAQEDAAPPFIEEWSQFLKSRGGGLMVLLAGIDQSRDGSREDGWSNLHINLADEKEDERYRRLSDTQSLPDKVEQLLSPLAHAGRVRLAQALVDGPLSAAELTARTGLRGGNLYHHLRELSYVDLVESTPDKRFALTGLGLQLLLTILAMANAAIPDREERSLGKK